MSSPEPEVLRENDLFSGVPLDTLAEFLREGDHRRFPAGRVLIQEDSSSDCIYYIQDGSVQVSKGEGKLEVATLHEGECFGEMSLFGKDMASARVLSDTSLEAYCFPGELIHRYIEKDHEFCLNFLKNIIQRLSNRLRTTTTSLYELRSGLSE